MNCLPVSEISFINSHETIYTEYYIKETINYTCDSY